MPSDYHPFGGRGAVVRLRHSRIVALIFGDCIDTGYKIRDDWREVQCRVADMEDQNAMITQLLEIKS
jgi:TATA-box binding protein (TBP) (component of TFIID and TFIIIB)